MKRIFLLSGFVIILISSFTLYLMLAGTSEAEKAAANFAKEYVEEEYQVTTEQIDVTDVIYSEAEDRYAVSLQHEETDYEFALRLDEDQDLSFILDVTGQFDKFGLAYCH
ncbi:hypothetical protein LGQ02_02185 [Bacillus shivajii]|uniref:hypothetical protein n=1 Tax=Bacillus shivajii TaxID=1983719 RepID=UPI001CFBD058|nr:hypothetical protein [Bacillus shivajii]UCZ53630.1 hypothetical protein LGQ02_02185 [Bacillus shivajii]